MGPPPEMLKAASYKENEEGTAGQVNSSLIPLLPLPESVILGDSLSSLCLVSSSIKLLDWDGSTSGLPIQLIIGVMWKAA